MNVLALEPYYGGSHKAFLDQWRARSRHSWTVLTLPANKWKWRMRHGAHALADEVAALQEEGKGHRRWDVIFCSDMLNLAEFYGLAPVELRAVPAVAYFHENQLTYPVRCETERDYHFGYTNMTTAVAARRVWFNSEFNRSSFLEALPTFLKRMPDHYPEGIVEQILARSEIQHPGIEELPKRGPRNPGPLRILWAARWEHDKNPAAFFQAIASMERAGVDYRISVIGEQFRDCPPIFAQAHRDFAHRIDRWGYQQTREEYVQALLDTDVFVSTATHEFFGLSAVEAIAAGAYPLLPNRLAYPELLSDVPSANLSDYLCPAGTRELSARLTSLARRFDAGESISDFAASARRAIHPFLWTHRAPALDDAIEAVGDAQTNVV